jgi:hypothetical protein
MADTFLTELVSSFDKAAVLTGSDIGALLHRHRWQGGAEAPKNWRRIGVGVRFCFFSTIGLRV